MKKKVLVAGVAAAIVMSSGMTCFASSQFETMTPQEYAYYIMAGSKSNVRVDKTYTSAITLYDGTVVTEDSLTVDLLDGEKEHIVQTLTEEAGGVPIDTDATEYYTDSSAEEWVTYYWENGVWSKSKSLVGSAIPNFNPLSLLILTSNYRVEETESQIIITTDLYGGFIQSALLDRNYRLGAIDDNDAQLQLIADANTDQLLRMSYTYAPDGAPAEVQSDGQAVGTLNTLQVVIDYSGYGTTSVEIPADVIAAAVPAE